MNTTMLTGAVMAGLAAFVVGTLLLVKLFYWLSGGELWGLALLLTLVSAPFCYMIAKALRP